MKDIKEISEKNPFRVPENYFEEVNKKIISTTAEQNAERLKISPYRKLRPYLAVAASVALLVALSYAAIHVFSPKNNNPVLPEITLSEFSDHYLNDIDLLTLEQNTAIAENFYVSPDLSSSDIIDYLIFENIDINEIYEMR